MKPDPSNPRADLRLAAPIGALAGAASALVFLAGLRGGPVGTLFLLASPLPLTLIGLGWGRAAVYVGALVGTALLAAMGNPAHGIVFLAFAAAAPILVTQLALAPPLHPGPDGGDPTLPGRILVALATLGGAIVLLALIGAEVSGGFGAMIDRALGGPETDISAVTRELSAAGLKLDRAGLVALLTRVLPPAFATGWLTLAVLNALLAEEILARSGRALRPPPAYSTLTLPRGMLVALIGALGLCLLPGLYGLFGAALLALVAVAYFFLGLAVIHAMSRRLPARPFTLGVLYLCIAFFVWPALILALLGLADQLGDLRGRAERQERETK